MLTRYFVYWVAIPGSEIGAVGKPESREYSTVHWAEKRAREVFEGWQAQIVLASAPTEELIESVRQELIDGGQY